MIIGQAKPILTQAIEARLPVLLTGPPGVGKTHIVKQVADQLGQKLFVSHPVIEDPTDYKGLPWFTEGKAKFMPIGQLDDILSEPEPFVWFVDDVGQAPMANQGALMQFTDPYSERSLDGKRLPEHCAIVMATNLREHGAGVSGFLEPFKNRFVTVLNIEPDVPTWTKWAVEHKIHPAVIGYVNYRPDNLSSLYVTNGIETSPSPRGYAHLSNLLSWSFPPEIELELFRGAVGDAVAAEFMAFREVFERLPDLSKIEKDPMGARLPDEYNEAYACITAMATRTNENNIEAFMKYAERFDNEELVMLYVTLAHQALGNQFFATEAFINRAETIGKILTETEGENVV
jgi:hypothetical protein